jgi:hypothetical protein
MLLSAGARVEVVGSLVESPDGGDRGARTHARANALRHRIYLALRQGSAAPVGPAAARRGRGHVRSGLFK